MQAMQDMSEGYQPFTEIFSVELGKKCYEKLHFDFIEYDKLASYKTDIDTYLDYVSQQLFVFFPSPSIHPIHTRVKHIMNGI